MWVSTLNYDRVEIYHFCHGRKLETSEIYHLFIDYGMECYFEFFYKIEEQEIERKLGKYFDTVNAKQIGIKEQKWIINKLRSIDDRKKIVDRVAEKFSNVHEWKCFMRGKELDYRIIRYPEKCEHFKEKYSRYLNYFSSIAGIHYNHTIFILTILALIVAVLSLVISAGFNPIEKGLDILMGLIK